MLELGMCLRPWSISAVMACILACAEYESFVPDEAHATAEDGVTARAQNVPMLFMGGGVPQGEECTEVAARSRLQTFPEREDVPATPVAYPPGANVDAGQDVDVCPIGSAYGVVQMVPVSPLSDRWYLVGVTDLPKEVKWWSGDRFYRGPDAFVGVRFRVGTQPAVLSLRRSDGSGWTDVQINFSEKVMAQKADEPWLEVRSLTNPSLPGASCGRPGPGEPVDSIRARCEALPRDDVLQATVRAFSSADGSKSVADATYQLDPPALLELPNGERALYIEPSIN
jgi:hypothetical protein